MQIQNLLDHFKERLHDLYGPRLRKVILYGSWARDEATADSDVDVAVVLDGKVQPGREIDRMIDIITDLNLEYDTLLAVYPVSSDDYAGLNSPLMLNLRREGVTA